MASRRATTWCVALFSQAFGLGFILLVFPFLTAHPPLLRDLVWGGLAGIAGAAGIGFLYRGLAVGRMSVVSPITAVLAASLPVVWGSLHGERPSFAALAGIALALLAVVLVSAATDQAEGPAGVARIAPGVPAAILAGCGFGVLFIMLAQTSAQAGMWPLIGARLCSIPVLFGAALATRSVIVPPRGSFASIALAGVLDMSANVLYLLSLRYTILAIAAVVTSLYPASTVLLARVVLREYLNARQWCGVACAGAGVVLIALR